MLFCWVMIALLVQAAPQDEVSSAVSLKSSEVWLQTASGERQLTHDGVPKKSPALSPSGNMVAYAVYKETPQGSPEEEDIVLVNTSGEVVRRIIPQTYVSASSEELTWIDEARIGLMGCSHANCDYWILDSASGKTLQIMRGGFDFIWSHNRQFVARHFVTYGEAPEGQPLPEQDAVLLNQDDVVVYPPGKGTSEFDWTHGHEIGGGKGPSFVWSPDDKWVAFTDLIGPEDDWYVVILSPSGRMLRDTLPIDPDYDATLEWLDDTHLDARTSKQVFHFALKGEQFSEVRGKSDAMHP